MLCLSDVVKAQTSMFSAGADEQPETRQIGGSLNDLSCKKTGTKKPARSGLLMKKLLEISKR